MDESEKAMIYIALKMYLTSKFASIEWSDDTLLELTDYIASKLNIHRENRVARDLKGRSAPPPR